MERVLSFLRDLRAHNDREWFTANKDRCKAAEAVVSDFAAELIAELGAFDPSVRGLTPRDTTYRIYRDTRFSHDKTPYKTHFGVYVCPGGKKSGNAGYYFHIEPSGEVSENAAGTESSAGTGAQSPGLIGYHLLDAGIYMPDPAVLKSVRDEIFDNGPAILAAIELAAKAGFALDRSNSLKRTPNGWPAGTEWDDYLKLKDLHLSKIVDNDYILAPDLAQRAATDLAATHEFMKLMHRSVRFAREEQ